MRKVILGLSIGVILSSAVFAQRTVTGSSVQGKNQTSVSRNGGNVALQSGTQLAAQLQNSLDVQKARVGDQVVLKTTKSIKQNGQVVIEKNARLIGKVTEVQSKTKGNAMSRVGIVFDSLQQGNTILPIEATIVSITQAQSRTRLNDDFESDVSSSSSSRTSTQSTGGGLLGGVTQTVGGVLNTTTQTVSGVTNTAQTTVGGTLRGIQIFTDSSAESSSTLSLQGGNLRLEKGTTFNLRVVGSASKQD